MRMLSVLPAAAVLLLWAATDTCLGRRRTSVFTTCPAHCTKFAIYINPNGTAVSMKPNEVDQVQSLEEILVTVKPGVRWVVIVVDGRKIEVPSSIKVQIQAILKRFPHLIELFIGILNRHKNEPPKSLLTLGTTKSPPKTPKLPVKTNPPRVKVPTTRTATKRTKPTRPRPVKTKPTPKKKVKSTRTTTKQTKATRHVKTKPTPKKKVKSTRTTTKRTKATRHVQTKPTPKKTVKNTRTTTKRTKATRHVKTKPTAKKTMKAMRTTTKRTEATRPVKTKPTAKKTMKAMRSTTMRTKRTKQTKTTEHVTNRAKSTTPKPKPPSGLGRNAFFNHSNSGPSIQNMQMPDIRFTQPITAVPGIDSKALILLGYLFSQPNYFPVIYQMLIQLGFKFSSLNAPVNSVAWGGLVIPFPQPLVVSYRVNVAGGTFLLPRDAPKLALYLSTHGKELAVMASFLRQVGGMYSISGASQITGFTIFGQFYRFTKPVVTTAIVSGRSYVLPRDIGAILVAVKNNPAEFYRIMMLLEAFGVRFKKSSDHVMQGLTPDKQYNINIFSGVRIQIDNKPYDIPADLETIFQSSEGFKVGALLSALQEKGVPVNVDEKTGIIAGIIIKNVLVPFPYTIDLRFKMGNTVYMIPRDLEKLISVLEKKNMPTKVLSILYNRYGVIPVRNSDNIVIAVSFNGKKYPVKVQPMTTVVIRSRKFLLPRDTAKMVYFVSSFKADEKIGFKFLRALKVAGFMLINDDDGAMHSIQKGAQVIALGLELRITVQYGGKIYKVPKDLMRIVKDVRKLGKPAIEDITKQLKSFDVEVTKKDNKLTILFNSVMYVVDLQSGNVQG